MTLNEYQAWAETTAIYPRGEKGFLGPIYCALKLNGEAGEVAEKIGKMLRDNNGVMTETLKLDLALEVGDILWYCSNLAREIGYTLEKVAEMNQRKLESRKERGKLGGSGDHR